MRGSRAKRLRSCMTINEWTPPSRTAIPGTYIYMLLTSTSYTWSVSWYYWHWYMAWINSFFKDSWGVRSYEVPVVIVNSIMLYYCKADTAYVRISSDKLLKMEEEIMIVEYGSGLYDYWNLPWREEYWLGNSSRRVFYWVIGVWVVRLNDQHIIWIIISSWQHGRPAITYRLGRVHYVVGITGDPRILIVVWTLRMPSASSVRVSSVGSFRFGCGDSASRFSYGKTRGEAC